MGTDLQDSKEIILSLQISKLKKKIKDKQDKQTTEYG